MPLVTSSSIVIYMMISNPVLIQSSQLSICEYVDEMCSNFRGKDDLAKLNLSEIRMYRRC